MGDSAKQILNNPCLSYSSNVGEICNNVFGKELNYFSHIRVYPDGRFVGFPLKREVIEWLLIDTGGPPVGYLHYDELESGLYFPKMEHFDVCGLSSEDITQLKERFKFTNPMIMFKKYEDFFDAFSFDVHVPNPYEYYATNLDQFERFIWYYKDSANKMLEKVKSTPFHVNQEYVDNAQSSKLKLQDEHSIVIPPSVKIKKYELYHNGKFYTLSSREYDCLRWVARGATAKTVAKNLCLSPRTVEHYLERIKDRLGTRSKSELVKLFWDNKITA